MNTIEFFKQINKVETTNLWIAKHAAKGFIKANGLCRGRGFSNITKIFGMFKKKSGTVQVIYYNDMQRCFTNDRPGWIYRPRPYKCILLSRQYNPQTREVVTEIDNSNFIAVLNITKTTSGKFIVFLDK